MPTGNVKFAFADSSYTLAMLKLNTWLRQNPLYVPMRVTFYPSAGANHEFVILLYGYWEEPRSK